MKLTNFRIENDSIAINFNDKYLDLHNNFDFRSFHYDITSRQLELIWTRSKEEWANENIPSFKLIFRDVSFLKIRERDSSLPETEDSCLSLIVDSYQMTFVGNLTALWNLKTLQIQMI